jgi:signal transduction histidine kinase
VEARALLDEPPAQACVRLKSGRHWLLLPLESALPGSAFLQLAWDGEPPEPDLELLSAVVRLLLGTRSSDGTGEGGETERLRAVLEHSERLSQLGKMAAGIAHEVGNPLAGISSIVQTLLIRTEDETARERLRLVKEQVGRINAIIRQLVEYSRPSTERRRATDLNELVRDTARLMRFEPRARGVDLTLELDDRLPAVPVTPHQVQQVFLNLFHNAIDATEGTGWRSVRVHSGRQGPFAVFTVEDNGCGIAAEHLPRVFDPFFTTKEPGRGTGLGLWICQGIVESMGGDLQLESQPGEGTRVTVRIRIPHEEAEHPGR